MKKNEIVLFETKDKDVTLSVPMDGDTVWLTQAETLPQVMKAWIKNGFAEMKRWTW